MEAAGGVVEDPAICKKGDVVSHTLHWSCGQVAPGRHQLNSHEAPVVGADSVTLDPSPFPWTSDAGWITQSPRSSVQLALGQREASMAEHTAMQLTPSPKVTLVNVMSRSQQPTSIDSLENVKEESKKSK